MPVGTSWQDDVGPMVRMAQIIVAALATGPTFFLVIALIIRTGGGMGAREAEPLVTYLALAVAAVALVLRFVVPVGLVSRRRKQIAEGTFQPGSRQPPNFQRFLDRTGDAGLLYIVFMTKTILSAAILEGAAFFLIIAFLIEGDPAPAVVAAVFIFGVVALFPTRVGTIGWIDRELHRLEEERQFAR